MTQLVWSRRWTGSLAAQASQFNYERWGLSLGVQEVVGQASPAMRVTASHISMALARSKPEEAAAIVALRTLSAQPARAISQFRHDPLMYDYALKVPLRLGASNFVGGCRRRAL